MSPAIVDGQDLDVLALAAPVQFFVFDSQIREVNLVIEVRKVVRSGPCANLILGPIRVAVVVVAVTVVLVEPLLIVPLQLVVEDYSVDSRTAFLKPLSCIHIGAEDLRVVFQLAGSFQACIEGLRGVFLAASATLEKLAPLLRQDHDGVPMTWNADGLDQALIAEVAEVGRPILRRGVVVVAKLAGGHDSEGPDSGQRAGLRSAEFVFAVTIANGFSVRSLGKIYVTHERVARIVVSLS